MKPKFNSIKYSSPTPSPLTHRAVILVVDSVNFDKEVSDVAGLLYDLLSDPVIHKKRISLLVACNKQDLTLARRAEAITKHLEKEM